MSRSRWQMALVAGACVAAVAARAPVAAQTASDNRQRTVRVAVVTKDDAPVTGLGAADFTVREDDATREILTVAPAPVADRIVVLVDDSQSTTSQLSYVRDGLKAFFDTIDDSGTTPQIRLMTFGDRPTLRTDFTPAIASLTRAADRIFPQTGAGSRFLEAITETCRDLRAKHLDHVVIVAFVNEAGPEFSEDSHGRVADALQAAGASLWTIAVRDPRGGQGGDAMRERAMVIGDVTRDSGGLNKMVLGPQGIVAAWSGVATLLTSEYAITYGRPDRLVPPSRVVVEVHDRDARVVAPRWAPR